MDEPSLGLSPLLTQSLFKSIRALHQNGITILMAEQNAAASLRMADRAYVLERGRIVLQGTGRELLENEEVKRAYLG
jgi:branched-chain amino acid transport system ATP-binding protein